MNQKQLIQETLKYFGKDRKLLRKTILDFSFENKKTKKWNRRIKTCTTHQDIFMFPKNLHLKNVKVCFPIVMKKVTLLYSIVYSAM
ncbi:hypothetical protein LEP1GSC005_3135 [Leptospira santarosai str. ST188]|nr:hypothetical protein LEP1GSC005_3135 [Leptospira santarosai str. ST188]